MHKLILILFISVSMNTAAFELENRLDNHASPYLAMHADDPVAWQEWNKETVNRAQKEGKLIYVSSGYFSCHWCHVMQRDSYKNKTVATLLNTHFIPVKVDREINSALDSKLIDFVERTQGHAGWPLNVFITPQGYPLVGMTYRPTETFIEILNKIILKWKNEKVSLSQVAKNTAEELSVQVTQSTAVIQKGLAQQYVNYFLLQVKMMADDLSGGFGEQNKFPSAPQLKLLLKIYKDQKDENIKQFLLLSLNNMASQGLHDQLGGGFFRYSVDPLWQIPHFEKMLYDNALLASLYTDAAKVFNNKKFARVAQRTLDFMLDVFQSEQGAFIASLSALDDKGIEGGYYLWQANELGNILTTEELKLVKLTWKIEGTAELEAGFHLLEDTNIQDAAKTLKLPVKKARAILSSAKKKMIAVRKARVVPQDEKLLAAWNGLALSAYAKAAKQFNNTRYAKAAEKIRNYIKHALWKNKVLLRAVKDNKVLAAAGLEDYSYVAQGLYDWISLSGSKQDQAWLEEIIMQSWSRFYTRQGWLLSEKSLLKYGQGEKVLADGVLPSASAIVIDLSLKLARQNNNAVLKEKALKALNSGYDQVIEQPFWYASHIQALYCYKVKN